jgi:recombinational DNA repair protein (RecF pathway)
MWNREETARRVQVTLRGMGIQGCMECHREWTEETAVHVYLDDGGVICGRCAKVRRLRYAREALSKAEGGEL